MNWIDVLAIILLIVVFIAGFREGAVKHFFSLIAVIIAIPLAGLTYRTVAGILSFLPGTNWENFLGFFICLGIFSLIIQAILYLPRRTVRRLWRNGPFYRPLGAGLNVLGTLIGLAVFVLVLEIYPIFSWLSSNVSESSVMSRLPDIFSFVQTMMPEIFRRTVTTAFYLG